MVAMVLLPLFVMVHRKASADASNIPEEFIAPAPVKCVN